jgi:hypothetical protein
VKLSALESDYGLEDTISFTITNNLDTDIEYYCSIEYYDSINNQWITYISEINRPYNVGKSVEVFMLKSHCKQIISVKVKSLFTNFIKNKGHNTVQIFNKKYRIIVYYNNSECQTVSNEFTVKDSNSCQ